MTESDLPCSHSCKYLQLFKLCPCRKHADILLATSDIRVHLFTWSNVLQAMVDSASSEDDVSLWQLSRKLKGYDMIVGLAFLVSLAAFPGMPFTQCCFQIYGITITEECELSSILQVCLHLVKKIGFLSQPCSGCIVCPSRSSYLPDQCAF